MQILLNLLYTHMFFSKTELLLSLTVFSSCLRTNPASAKKVSIIGSMKIILSGTNQLVKDREQSQSFHVTQAGPVL